MRTHPNLQARGRALLEALASSDVEAPEIDSAQAAKAVIPRAPDRCAEAPRGTKVHPISERAARELALRLITLKAQTNPAILGFKDRRAILMLASGVAAAFIRRGIAIDPESAEGIASAIQEKIPGAQDVLYGATE